MKKALKSMLLMLLLCAQLILPTMTVNAATTIYDNKTGSADGYDYELWKDSGNTSMTLNAGGTFSCTWSNINNALFRKGKKFDSTKTYSQIGNISIDYGCNYQPNGNSYLCVYGWTVDPLVEYYIVDSWGTWRPPGASSKGQITVDGGTYDVYETTRVNQPSIQGNTTFKQYWSVRTSKRTSGVISVTEHFKAWERLGMQCGKLYEAALNVEGYQSSGSANVYKNNITVGGSSSSSNQSSNQQTNQNQNNNNNNNNNYNNNSGSNTSGTTVQCESMTKSGQYTGNINSPFSGVALYANNDSVSFTQYFANGTHDFTLRGCSNNSNMARVDLKIGGQTKGTFYYGDNYPAEYTIKNVSHGTGNQKVELIVTADNGQWDAYIDYLRIGGNGTSSNSSSSSQNNNNNNNNYNNNNAANTNTNNNSSSTTLNKNTKMVALTFDDGPSSTTTQVLDVLQRYNAKATFFLIGNQINGSTKSIMQRQVNMGCELANHSYSHKDMSNMSAWEVQQEVEKTNDLIKEVTGKKPSFFRAPYLATSNTMFQNTNLTYIQGNLCDDYLSNVSSSQRVQKALSNVSDGQIILLHDFQGNQATVDALPQIISSLQSQGYTLVTLSELFYYKGIDQTTPGKIWSNVYR